MLSDLNQARASGMTAREFALNKGVPSTLSDADAAILDEFDFKLFADDAAKSTESDWDNAFKEALADQTNTGAGDVNKLLKQSTCNTDDFYKYLNKINSDYADIYAKTGKWPSDVQIPKSPDVLMTDGSIDWSKAPEGGYVLDSKGDAIKTLQVPSIGDIIDRNGPSSGRYVSPIVNNKPYSYDMRSLPYIEDSSSYHKYQVVGDLTKIKVYVANCTDTKMKAQIDAYVTKYYNGDYSKLNTYYGKIAKIEGWGSGGGFQYEFPMKIEWLIQLGLLKEIY